MKNNEKLVVVVVVVAFLLGDLEGVARGNRRIRKFRKNQNLVHAQNVSLCNAINDILHGRPTEESVERLNTDLEFYKIVSKENL